MAKSRASVVEAESGRRTAETHKLRKRNGKRREPPIAECGMRIDWPPQAGFAWQIRFFQSSLSGLASCRPRTRR